MNTIIEWLSNISVEQIVSYISSVGMVITAIVSIVISIKAKIKTNENIDIQSEIDKNLTAFKAEMVKQMTQAQTDTIEAVSKSNQYVIDTVTEQQKNIQADTQKQIDAATIKVNSEIAMLKNIKDEEV